MKINNKRLIISLAFPVICLLGLVVFKVITLSVGKTLVLPISGYDPRDLLSGHYLVYQIDYGNRNLCDNSGDSDVYVCVRQKGGDGVESAVVNSPDNLPSQGCDAVIKGDCKKRGRFTAGIERFYIPETESALLDRIVRDKKAKIVVKVDKRGKAVIKDMLIDDIPWKEYVKTHKNEKR